MNLVDANVLLYAVNDSDPNHAASRAWMETALNGREPVGFAWVVLLAFLRLSTKSGVFPNSLTPRDALSNIQTWLEQGPSTVVHPTARHFDILAGLLADTRVAGDIVQDAHLAALALEYHATVVSYDHDFGRFRGVRWHPPT